MLPMCANVMMRISAFFHMVSYTEEEEEEAFEEAPFSLSSAASFPDRKSLANIFFKPLGPFGSGLPFKCV